MKIAVPKEIKDNEHRVGLVPGGVKQLCDDGHEVFVQTKAGININISDEDFHQAGATIVSSLEECFAVGEMIIKVKEPQKEELKYLRPNQILYTYLHLAADKSLTEGLRDTGAIGVAYETITNPLGELPLLVPMSEVAGRMSTQIGAQYLQLDRGGKGILLGGVPGVRRAKVTVIGCGIAGTNAIKMAMGLGADVIAIDRNAKRLAQLDDLFANRLTTLFSNAKNIEESVVESDLVIGAALVAGAKAPVLVTRDMISKMERGSVVVDIAVDQGGCIETSRPTTHKNPTYNVSEVIHYCVSNMPGAVANTSTFSLTNVTLEHARKIAGLGLKEAISRDPFLRDGINTYDGKVTYRPVAETHGLNFCAIDELIEF